MKLLAAILAAAALAAAQSPAPASFDAASIRPAAPGRARAARGFHFDPGRITAYNVSLEQLIERAWNLKSYQVQGPTWLDSTQFDLSAETQQPLTQRQLLRLLRSFLTQQFRLKTHRAAKRESVYALVVASQGFKMKPVGPNGVLPPARGDMAAKQSGALPAGVIVADGLDTQGMHLLGNTDMDALADFLSVQLDQPVLNLTHIAGNYELHLICAPDSLAGVRMKLALSGPSEQASSPAPSLLAALPQQLGLKLDTRQAPIEILVVDSSSKSPIGN